MQSVTSHVAAVRSQVDVSAVKSGQSITALVLSTAFVMGWWPLALAMGLINLLSARIPRLSPLGAVYRKVLIPAGVRPDVNTEDPAPHQFAQALSGVVTSCGALLVAVGATTIGWLLVITVVVLAILNVGVGFCAGCFTYHQLHRFGLKSR